MLYYSKYNHAKSAHTCYHLVLLRFLNRNSAANLLLNPRLRRGVLLHRRLRTASGAHDLHRLGRKHHRSGAVAIWNRLRRLRINAACPCRVEALLVRWVGLLQLLLGWVEGLARPAIAVGREGSLAAATPTSLFVYTALGVGIRDGYAWALKSEAEA